MKRAVLAALLGIFWVDLGARARAQSPAAPAGPSAAAEAAQPPRAGTDWTATTSARRSPAGTFEALLAEALPSVDLETLIAPFLETCSEARRELDKARCRGSVAFLRQTMPAHTYAQIVTDPDAVTVSDYDARVKGFRIGAVGCLACKQPVAPGKGQTKRLVTLSKPDKSARSLAAALEVAQASLTFNDIVESRTWLAQVRPHLRAQFVFEPSDQEWTFGPSRGLAFNLLGARIFNHCTGEVLYSQPPSEAPADKYSEGNECGEDVSAASGAASTLPDKLDAAEISRAMLAVRPDIDACHKQFSLRGRADIDVTVSGSTGVPLGVVLRGSLEGTLVGQCLKDAVRKARFPRFQRETQAFSYPVLFDRQ
ncbi:MAG: hypothetical protein KA712_04415 [Myxococcales bacterium]|nr:hypothetical protein [Myxococcales bacterium]